MPKLPFELPPELYALLIPVVVGLLGTFLESVGTRYNLPILVAIGQRIEALFADLPKAIRGSRKTAAENEAASRRPSIPPLPVLALAMMMLGVPLALGCAGATPVARGAEFAQGLKLGYSVSAVALREAAELHYAWMKTLQEPGAAKAGVDAARTVGTLLDDSHAALERIRPLVATGKDAAAVKRELTDNLVRLEQVLELLAAFNQRPPPAVTEGIGYLHGFLLGGAS